MPVAVLTVTVNTIVTCFMSYRILLFDVVCVTVATSGKFLESNM